MDNKVKESKLIQLFLSPGMSPGPSIYEVSMEQDSNFICTCSGYKGRSTCKHIKFVEARVKRNNGSYPLELSSRATKEEAEKAKESPEEFRKFVIKYGKIEVC